MTNCERPQSTIDEAVCDALQGDMQEDPVVAAILRDVAGRTRTDLDSVRAFQEKINDSLGYIGYEEWNHILAYFHITGDSENIVSQIENLQTRLGVEVDGIVGPGTLREIYRQEYAQNYESLGILQQWRYQAFMQVGQDYPVWNRYVSELGRSVDLRANTPNVFNRNYYFGNTEGEPVGGGFINSALRERVPSHENTQGVRGYLRRIHGDFVLSMYVNGELVFASFASPGNVQRYGRGADTPQGSWDVVYRENNNVENLTAKVHYISGGEDSVVDTRNPDGSYNSAPMPFAVRVNAGVFTHAGNTTGDPESHGCIRLPLHYAMGVYEIFRMHGSIHWDTNYS